MIGKMDRKITFQRRATAQTGITNERDDVWEHVVTVWAQYLPKRGIEKSQGSQPIDVGEDDFRIWYRTDLTNDMRVVHNGENKAITSIEEFGRRDKMIIRTQRLK